MRNLLLALTLLLTACKGSPEPYYSHEGATHQDNHATIIAYKDQSGADSLTVQIYAIDHDKLAEGSEVLDEAVVWPGYHHLILFVEEDEKHNHGHKYADIGYNFREGQAHLVKAQQDKHGVLIWLEDHTGKALTAKAPANIYIPPEKD